MRPPQRQEAVLELLPDGLDLVEDPGPVVLTVVGRGPMTVLGEVGEEQISQKRADIEAHGPIEGEFRVDRPRVRFRRSEEQTSELQSLMRISYAVLCLKNKNKIIT